MPTRRCLTNLCGKRRDRGGGRVDCVYFSPGYCAIKEDTCPCPRQMTKEEADYEQARKLFYAEVNYKKTLCHFTGGSRDGGRKREKPKRNPNLWEDV